MGNEIKDSGAKREFETGARRDAAIGKGRCDLLPLTQVGKFLNDPVVENIAKFIESGDTSYLYDALQKSLGIIKEFDNSAYTMLLETSILYQAGAEKYGENNWKNGMPLYCYLDSGLRHYFKALRGDTDEPHYRGFAWNIFNAIWTCDNIPNAFENLVVIEK